MPALAAKHGLTVLPEPVVVHGSLPGLDVEVEGKRTRRATIIAASPRRRRALTDRDELVDFDNIWVCDLNPLHAIKENNA